MEDKELLGKKGVGENEKGENGFPSAYLFPKFTVFIFFPQQSFTGFPTTIVFSREYSMVGGRQVKDCWGKKGVGKMEKEKMVFPLLIFSPNPQFLYFFPNSQFSP